MNTGRAIIIPWRAVLLGAGLVVAAAPQARAQARPYVGYVYPAGGKQGTTFEVRLGGQGLDYVAKAIVSGDGVTARVTEYLRRLNNQEVQILNEQIKELKAPSRKAAGSKDTMMAAEPPMMMMAGQGEEAKGEGGGDPESRRLIKAIETRVREFVQTPACASISSLVLLEVTISPEAAPGPRELRLVTARGVSNPLVFEVGQWPERVRKPMVSASLQVLGKEAQALRKRPADEAEDRVSIPCTLNGQIASGEINSYRFKAKGGQHLVLEVKARQLVPFIADAVPGWFQPVVVVYDAQGHEVAYQDDYQFRPDPVLFFDVPQDGEYVAAIFDSIHRGREDFVYRLSIGEFPFVTSIFPMGGKTGSPPAVRRQGRNLEESAWKGPGQTDAPGLHFLSALRNGLVSNAVPFALDTLPEMTEEEANNSIAKAQEIKTPVIVNGRIERPDDRDVFRVRGKANETLVAEVVARRLDSPLDGVITLTDASGKILAFNDDREDLGAGTNTHHADPSFRVTLPSDGVYFVHVADTARQGGKEFAYRLRVGPPRPDFELRVVPSSAALRSKSTATVTVQAIRHDGFAGPIQVSLRTPPTGFSAGPATIPANQDSVKFTFKTDLVETPEPVDLAIQGSARIGDQDVAHDAVAAEDRMQAFLWKQLVPALDFKVLVFDPNKTPPPKHKAPERPKPPEKPVAVAESPKPSGPAAPPASAKPEAPKPEAAKPAAPQPAVVSSAKPGDPAKPATPAPPPDSKPKFTKQQIEGRLRQLKALYEEGLLTEAFYLRKVEECEAGVL